MKCIETVKELSEALNNLVPSTIGFVPTMGALHRGHASLVECARKECATVVVSVFVNPTQFNDKNDLKNYPRTMEADLALLESLGVDYVFAPTVDEIYPTPDTRQFDFGVIDKVMEGASRPGHFNGVGQVVSRLFEIVNPTKAYFGEKDFQQIAVIKSMVKQLGLGVQIVECPIIRDADGLALSSRNALLTPDHRAAAPLIYATLKQAVELSKTESVSHVKEYVESAINKCELLETIYFNVVDGLTMQSVEDWSQAETIQGCVAVQAGQIRLIDNVRLR